LRSGLLLRRSEALPRAGWPAARFSRSTAFGSRKGKLSIGSRDTDQTVLQLAGEAGAGSGEGESLAVAARTCTASGERAYECCGPFAHLARRQRRKEVSALHKSVTSQGQSKEKQLGRWESVAPLTPALSPLRGEGEDDGILKGIARRSARACLSKEIEASSECPMRAASAS